MHTRKAHACASVSRKVLLHHYERKTSVAGPTIRLASTPRFRSFPSIGRLANNQSCDRPNESVPTPLLAAIMPSSSPIKREYTPIVSCRAKPCSAHFDFILWNKKGRIFTNYLTLRATKPQRGIPNLHSDHLFHSEFRAWKHRAQEIIQSGWFSEQPFAAAYHFPSP